jgi:hypothetical protein
MIFFIYTYNILWSNSPYTTFPYHTSPSFETISVGLIILFSYMHMKYFDFIHHSSMLSSPQSREEIFIYLYSTCFLKIIIIYYLSVLINLTIRSAPFMQEIYFVHYPHWLEECLVHSRYTIKHLMFQ